MKRLLICLVLLGACTKEINHPQYTVDQEVDLHWGCVLRNDVFWTRPDTTIFDTVTIHSTGNVDDATDRCYERYRIDVVMPVNGYSIYDSCYCLVEFPF